MRSLSLSKTKDELDDAFAEIAALSPSLVFMFAAPALLRDAAVSEKIKNGLKAPHSIGCSSAGEIGMTGLLDLSVTFLAIKFDSTEVHSFALPLVRMGDSYNVGVELAAKLKGPKLKGVIVLTPGVNINTNQLVHGLNSQLGSEVIISGGMAGDDDRFEQTTTFHNGAFYPDYVVAVGLYGDQIFISTGSEGGWKPFGPARRVTRSDGPVVYEIDGKPALQLYKEYLGEQAKTLPASGISYPFAILREDRKTSGIIRSAMDVDLEKGSLIFAADVPQDSLVCLMHAESDALTEGASKAAKQAMSGNMGTNDGACALLVSCIGRRFVLSIDVDDEIDAARSVLGSHTQVAGYYAYGEICPYEGTGRAELHNQTMTITYMTEHGET